MGKVNQKGRSKHEPFIRLHRGVTGSAAWKALSNEAKALLIEIWARHNGVNNGEIGMSHRRAREALRAGNVKVQRAFADLQAKGFLIAHYRGHFNSKVLAGEGKASEWELTTEDYSGQPAKHTYRIWSEKQNTVPTLGTAGTDIGNRSDENIIQINETSSDTGNRYGRKRDAIGS